MTDRVNGAVIGQPDRPPLSLNVSIPRIVDVDISQNRLHFHANLPNPLLTITATGTAPAQLHWEIFMLASFLPQ